MLVDIVKYFHSREHVCDHFQGANKQVKKQTKLLEFTVLPVVVLNEKEMTTVSGSGESWMI